MKANLSRMWRNGIALLLAICMVVGFVPAVAFAETAEKINYVSLGDSMSNGYGFIGYEQNDYSFSDFLNGNGTYGNRAYPLQFEDYLTRQGYDVKHTKLGTSAMLPEHLLYLLSSDTDNFNDIPTDIYWGFRGYDGDDNNAYTPDIVLKIKDYFQTAVAEADVISIGIGNGTYGAFLMDFLMQAMGLTSDDYTFNAEQLTLDNALVLLKDQEHKDLVKKIYAEMLNKMDSYIDLDMMGTAPGMPDKSRLEAICDIVAYGSAMLVLSYEGILEQIDVLNGDNEQEVIIVGLMNTLAGVEFTDDDGNVLMPIGDLMGAAFSTLSAYMAAMPAMMQAEGKLQGITFYYADKPEVECFNDIFVELYDEGAWNKPFTDIDSATVLDRTINAVASFVTSNFSIGYDALKGAYDAAKNGSANDYQYIISGVYKGIEKATADNMRKQVPAKSFLALSNLSSVMNGLIDMAELQTVYGTAVYNAAGDKTAGEKAVRDNIYNTLIDNGLAGMCTVFGLFQVGNGLSVHPTPHGHDELAAAVINAYATGHTAKDETLDNINWALGELQKIIAEYGPDMAQSVWQQWIDAGYVGAIDTLIDELWTELQADHEYYKNAVPEINKAVQAMMTEQNRLIDELNALNKQLTDKKAELEDVIAKQEISDVTLPNIKIEVDLGNNTQTEVYEHECVVEGEGIEAELKAAIADLEHAIAVVEALIADITADIEDMVALAEQIAAAAAEFEKTFADIQKAAKDLENAFNAIKEVLTKDADKTATQITDAFNAARDTALAAVSVLDTAMGVASDMSGDIEELLGMIEDAAEALQGEVMGDLKDALDINYLSDTEKSILYVTAMVALPLLEEYKDDLKAELTNLVNTKKDEYTDLIQDEKDKWLLHIQEKNDELLLKKDEMVKYIKDEYAIQEQKIRDEYENVIKPELLQKRDELTLDLQAKQGQMEQYLKDLAEATDDAAKAEIQAAIDLLQPQIDRVSEDLATVNADLECMTEHLDAALAEAYDKVSAEAEKLYGEAIDALDKAIVELNAAMDKAVQELTDTMNKAVQELEDAFNKQIAALDAAIKAQIAALELEQKKAEFLKKIDDAEQAVKDLLAKIDNEIKTKVAEAEDKIRDEYNAAMAELLKQKAALEAELKAAQKALADAADAAKAEIEKQIDEIEDEIARVEKEIADAAAKLEADLKEAHDKIVKEVNDAYAQTLAELEKAVDDLKKAMAKEIAELEKELDELIASLDGEVKDLLAELKNKVADSFNDILDNFKFDLDLDLGVNLDGINDALNALKDALVDAGIDSLESLGNILSKLFQDMLYAATHADLTIDNDFKYLALGDGSAASKSYAEDLAEMLQAEATENGIKKPITFVNHAEVGKTVAEEAADLCDEVASADLITLGYSQTEMMAKALKVIVEEQEVDWVGLVGKEAAVYIEEALEKVFAELDAVELPEMIAPYFKAIVEAYAYGAVEYAVKMPALLLAIREVNKDAVVINVGMYNPLADVVIDGMDMSQFNEYFNYLIDGVAVYGIGLAMLTNQIDYVDARDVAVAQPELKFTTLIAQLMGNDGLKALYPSEEGDDYIANQIAKALNLSFTGLLGDVNDDGKVLANDAMLVLQYSVGQIKADKLNLSVADVTGDGKILANDAMEILQYSVGARTRFSCEK